jgi:EmrB/QacA subfamily drug resistance transporter
MAGVDSRIVIVGLPEVAKALGADAEQAIWFTQAYSLGSTIMLLIIGRLSDIFGRLKIYNIGFIIFTVGSALTSLSQVPNQVILFRAIQGFGSGILGANSLALIADSTPTKELGFSVGLNSVAFRFGAIVGLTMSGVILSFLDWRALFYINVPIGVFGTIWAHRRLKEVHKPEKTEIDWIGFATFTTFITALLLSLTFAAYGLSDRIIVYAFLAIALASLVVFTVIERRQENPMLDLRLLRIREFTGAVTAQGVFAASWGAVLLLLSLYLQLILGLSAFDAGIRIIPFELAFLSVGTLSGRLSDRFGPLPFTTGGIALTAVALYLFSTVDASTPYLNLVGIMIVFGVGVGIFGSPNMSSIMSAVPPERRGVASAFNAMIWNVGYTISINLTMLLMTTTIPYNQLTQIIAGEATLTSQADKLLFSEGMSRTYLWLSLLTATAIVPSVLRGKRITKTRFSG